MSWLWGEEKRLRNQGAGGNEVSVLHKMREDLRIKRDSLSKKRDSLSNIISKLINEHAIEITKTRESQKVLQEMRKAVKADNGAKANKILMDYRRLLLDATSKKVRFGEIDWETSRAEVKAMYKIVKALEMLAFPPVKIVDDLH